MLIEAKFVIFEVIKFFIPFFIHRIRKASCVNYNYRIMSIFLLFRILFQKIFLEMYKNDGQSPWGSKLTLELVLSI